MRVCAALAALGLAGCGSLAAPGSSTINVGGDVTIHVKTAVGEGCYAVRGRDATRSGAGDTGVDLGPSGSGLATQGAGDLASFLTSQVGCE